MPKLKFISNIYFEDNISKGWSYNYYLPLSSKQAEGIKFNDGEVESIQWLSEQEIYDKVEKKENITSDSVKCFKELLQDMKKLN